MENNVIDVISFKLREGVSRQQFLAASDELNVRFLSLQKGYIDRTLAEKEGCWTDFVMWETADDATNAMKASEQSAVAWPFFECIEEGSVEMQHLAIVKVY
jgi:hypothetical protein